MSPHTTKQTIARLLYLLFFLVSIFLYPYGCIKNKNKILQWPTIVILQKKARTSNSTKLLAIPVATYGKRTNRANRWVFKDKLTDKSLSYQRCRGYSCQTYPGFAWNQQSDKIASTSYTLRCGHRRMIPLAANSDKQSSGPMYRHRCDKKKSRCRQWYDSKTQNTKCQSTTD